MIINENDLDNYPQRYRTHLINSIAGFKSANLIGNINAEKISNLSMISSIFHLGADPALLGFISRPHTVTRDTLENILSQKCYTINHVNQAIYQPAHQTSARYPTEVSEFSATGLREEYTTTLLAPYVEQSHIKIGMRLVATQDITYNNTVMIIGQIIEIIVPDEHIATDGFVDLEASGSLCVSGLDKYHQTQALARLPYAKPTTV